MGNLYAGLSVTMHTGAGGAVSRERLIEEGTQRGLPALPLAVRGPLQSACLFADVRS